MKHIAKWFLDLKITGKIMLFYLGALLIFLLLGVFTYEKINTMTTDKVRQLSMETVNSVNANLDFMLSTLNNQSIILLSSETLQNTLSHGSVDFSFTSQQNVSGYLAEFMNFNNMISSIYVFDNYGHEYSADCVTQKKISFQDMKGSAWFGQMNALRGKSVFKLNGGGTFSGASGNYISLIRVINDIDTQEPIGYLMVNVSADYINQSLVKGITAYDTHFVLIGADNEDILNAAQDRKFKDLIGGALATGTSSFIKKVSGQEYIVSGLTDDLGWKIVGITPFKELTKQDNEYKLILLTDILVNILIIMVGLMFASLFISKPIRRLASSMQTVEKGELREIEMRTGRDEIGRLKDVYNLMIERIQMLFDNIVREHRLKREKELEVLLTQIKPHFLYNSFDAISSLALSGETTAVYDMSKALGRFYKAFLNSGSEVTTVGEELRLVENYLTIQKIRLGDKFTLVTRYDERAFSCRMPRLILQPLVENAIHHGIKPKRGNGVVTLGTRFEGDAVVITVTDNGVGMDEDRLRSIVEGRSRGVGLSATIERLNLYFNAADILEIDSEKGKGTQVTITMKVDQETDNGSKQD